MYRPEYIELRIHEAGGLLAGDYKARYRITDRALSPNVEFHLSGAPALDAGSKAVLPWTSAHGTTGRIQLHLLNRNSLKTEWNVAEGATAMDLVSGNAILTRAK